MLSCTIVSVRRRHKRFQRLREQTPRQRGLPLSSGLKSVLLFSLSRYIDLGRIVFCPRLLRPFGRRWGRDRVDSRSRTAGGDGFVGGQSLVISQLRPGRWYETSREKSTWHWKHF